MISQSEWQAALDYQVEKDSEIIGNLSDEIKRQDVTIANLRQEIDRLNGWIDLNRQTRDLAMSELAARVRDLTRERDYLKWAADEHLAALDEDNDGLSEIYEVEVPNDDEAVSYAIKTR